MSPTPFSEDKLVEQPAIALFAELGWATVNASAEVLGAGGTLGRLAKTEVVLYRSPGAGRPFRRHSTLASRSFGVDRMCLGVVRDTPCRFDFRAKKFNATDYLSISAVDERVAVAFTLTLGDDPVQFATTYVKTVDTR